VGGHDSAGDVGHTAGHHTHQLGLGEPVEERADGEGSFSLAHEDTGGDVERLGTADRKSTRLNSSHGSISYAVFCLKKQKHNKIHHFNRLGNKSSAHIGEPPRCGVAAALTELAACECEGSAVVSPERADVEFETHRH